MLVGAVRSMLTVSSRHAEKWPTLSTMRVLSTCTPSVEMVTAGFWSMAPPSIVRSILATPEPAPSEPATVTLYATVSQPAGAAGVALTGTVVSTRTVSGRHADGLPAMSTARVSSVWTPSVATSAGLPS